LNPAKRITAAGELQLQLFHVPIRLWLWPQATGETVRLLAGQRQSLEAVLDCSDFNTESRNKNHHLLASLTSGKTLTELLKVLTTNPTRCIHKKFVQLDDLDNSSTAYGIGTLSRMVSKAIDKWPEYQPGPFPPLVRDVDKAVVFQAMVDLMHESRLEIVVLAFVGPELKVEPKRELTFDFDQSPIYDSLRTSGRWSPN
jgi:hypothetical protein